MYPRAWRTARLVLLRKESRPLDSPSAYRPISLLDEVGKLLERIIAARLEAHMERREPGWHDSQYGFRRGRSTVDAVRRVCSKVEDMVSQEGVAIAVSLDITNAFNSIPWARILEALNYYEIPEYLVRVIRAYLCDRWIIYNTKDGETRKPVECGVPQGRLGLSVSPTKSEALGFFDRRRREPPPTGLSININGEEVPVRHQMRYLGLIIDSQWTFEPHIEQLVPRVTAAANALCGLLPNVGGAGVGVRRLYEGVVKSRVLYGAPVWAEDMMESRRSRLLLRRLQRTTAIRTARSYRTVSYATATVLAAPPPPFELQALALRRVYDKRKISRLDGRATTPPPDSRPPSSAREEAKRETWERWRSQLVEEDTTRQHRAVRAVLPNWETWREQGGVPLTFRMTQMLTGHGVFGEYLLRIRREVTSICHQCEEEEDTVQHTWERCPAWADQRRVLQLDIGESVAREAIVKAMLRGHQEYTAVRSFCLITLVFTVLLTPYKPLGQSLQMCADGVASLTGLAGIVDALMTPRNRFSGFTMAFLVFDLAAFGLSFTSLSVIVVRISTNVGMPLDGDKSNSRTIRTELDLSPSSGIPTFVEIRTTITDRDVNERPKAARSNTRKAMVKPENLLRGVINASTIPASPVKLATPSAHICKLWPRGL
ncbi:uncharacterized protein LOC132915636 [Bombus pascuorum]|uniref:uncharacterized protein LOC132915636 n=1 Tax=Bombus pascuorum TaxID=65598 RepID=UPI00298DEC51|nr:uncharacterized protein LOC132915636 [Bombus pascuorum]